MYNITVIYFKQRKTMRKFLFLLIFNYFSYLFVFFIDREDRGSLTQEVRGWHSVYVFITKQ